MDWIDDHVKQKIARSLGLITRNSNCSQHFNNLTAVNKKWRFICKALIWKTDNIIFPNFAVFCQYHLLPEEYSTIEERLIGSVKCGLLEVTKVLKPLAVETVTVRRTLLNTASYHGFAKIVKWLIENGAVVSDQDSYSLKTATEEGHSEVVDILVSHDVNVHAEDDHALKYACQSGYSAIVETLIVHGANVRADQDYSLRLAAKHGHVEIAQILLANGAEPNVLDDSAMDEAIAHGRYELVKL